MSDDIYDEVHKLFPVSTINQVVDIYENRAGGMQSVDENAVIKMILRLHPDATEQAISRLLYYAMICTR